MMREWTPAELALSEDTRKKILGLLNGEKSVFKREWPIWAKALKLLSVPKDTGIGDVVARLIGDENSEAFQLWHKATFGSDCGCTGRQQRWNKQYPLNK